MGTNNPNVTNKNKESITKATRELLKEAKQKADYVYIMGLVPYKGSHTGPKSKIKLNRIIQKEAVNQEVCYIATPEQFITDDDTSHLFEQDQIHVSPSGANCLVKSIMKETEGWQDMKTRKRRKKSPDMNMEPKKIPRKGRDITSDTEMSIAESEQDEEDLSE